MIKSTVARHLVALVLAVALAALTVHTQPAVPAGPQPTGTAQPV
jgi:hypothetical protein